MPDLHPEHMENHYRPRLARIIALHDLTPDTRLFRLQFVEEATGRTLTYRPGQFFQVSVLGTGEAPISIASTPSRPEIELCIRRVGRVTQALHRLKEGGVIGLRGPYGNGFPLERLRGQDLLLIGGGLGLAPLRAMLYYALDHEGEFGQITLLYGARTPQDALFREELRVLEKEGRARILVTVDRNEEGGWPGRIGVVTTLFPEVKVEPARTFALICVPPVAFRFVIPHLLDMGFSGERILMSLERKMQCGIGKCGYCNVGPKHTCLDGPVFSYWDAANLPGML